MKYLKNSRGFTLIEMMIVLLIISVLVLVAIPNVTKHSQTIDEKGCEAYIEMVEGQVEAFKINYKKVPKTEDLISEMNIKSEEEFTCPDGTELTIGDEGEVQKVD